MKIFGGILFLVLLLAAGCGGPSGQFDSLGSLDTLAKASNLEYDPDNPDGGTTGASGTSGTSDTSATTGTSGSTYTSGSTGTSGMTASSDTSGTTGSSGTTASSSSTATSATSGGGSENPACPLNLALAAVIKQDCPGASLSCSYTHLGIFSFPVSLKAIHDAAKDKVHPGPGWGHLTFRICDPGTNACFTVAGQKFPNGGVVDELETRYPGCGFVIR